MSPRIALLALLVSTGAPAQTAAPARSVDESRIEGQTGAGLQGSAAVNVAAGAGNVQANVRAIAVADQGAAAASVLQHTDASEADIGRDARAVFAGAAFDGAQGVVGINQAAGAANAQANILVIAPKAMAAYAAGIEGLALAAPGTDPADTGAGRPLREARIDAGALRAPGGVLQLNQSAGVGNASANVLVLQLPGGTP